MAQITLNSTGVASSGSLVLQSNGTTTAATFDTAQKLTLPNDAVVSGLTVGKGAGAVSTNTAVGASALESNSTGSSNSAIGRRTLINNSTGSSNTALGNDGLYSNTTGSFNVALGQSALFSNTTADNNTAIGYQAAYNNTTGIRNFAGGNYSLVNNTTGGYNIGIGYEALRSNTTASYNTAVGYQAGYTSTTNGSNTSVGFKALYATTGGFNTAIGDGSGIDITSGTKNTIVGRYGGNQGGLDIRTASNKVVLSDGDGNPVFSYGTYPNGAGSFALSSGYSTLGVGGTGSTGTGALFLNGEASSGFGPVLVGYANGASQWQAGSNSWIKGGTTYNTYTVMAGGTGGVNLTNGATSWTSASDERLKDIIEPISDGLNKVASLRAVIGKYKDDETEKRRPFLIAQDVQAVLPEAISESRNSKDDETEYLQLAYTEVIPLLVVAIKELKATVDAQQVEIDTLKGQA